MNGRITGIKPERGFGFLVGEDGREYFVHASAVHDLPWHWLSVGMRVTFKPANDPRGGRLRAFHVQEAA